MRVSCLQENLAKGLSIVGRAVSARSTLPVLGNILIEAKDNQLRLAATNLEIAVNCWIGARVEDEGAITVPARLLSEFVNKLPPEQIDLELAVRTQTLNLRCARYTATMKGIDASEFPIVTTTDMNDEPGGEDAAPPAEGVMVQLDMTGLRKMIDQVAFAASGDESRPTLTGVEVSFKGERLTMAATDGFRLSVRSAHLDAASGPDEDMTVIVPARSLGEVARILADGDESRPVHLLISRTRNQALFQIWGKRDEGRGNFHRVELVSQLIDARFPDYHAIIPRSHTTRTVVDKSELLKAVRVADLFARDNNNIVRLAITPSNGENQGQVQLTATSSEMGDSVNEIDAMVEGEGIEISFNAKYLIDVLSQIDEPQIVLETTQGTRPGALRPLGMGEEEFLHVVMPMHPPR